MNNLIQIFPRDYLELGAKGRIEQALAELVKLGYIKKLKGDNYKLTKKGKGYAECLIDMMQGD